MPAFKAPPTANGGHGEGARVMVSADVHKAGVAPEVIDAVGKARGTSGLGKSCPLTWMGLFGGQPLLAGIIVVADEFFLLGVHRNDRPSCRQGSFNAGVDMAELRIPVGVAAPSSVLRLLCRL